jgi:hypothetical protein
MSKTALPPFSVGQVIYLIPRDERKVIPAQITEEILRRTISGQETVWMVQLAGNQKSMPLDPDAAEYFISVDELRSVLISRTTDQVNAMLDRTIAVAQEIFDVQNDITVDALESQQQDEIITVILPDGTRTKVKTK